MTCGNKSLAFVNLSHDFITLLLVGLLKYHNDNGFQTNTQLSLLYNAPAFISECFCFNQLLQSKIQQEFVS